MADAILKDPKAKKKLHPARRAVLRGLGVVLPPLLTIVVFLWAWSVIESNILVRMETAAAWGLTFVMKDSFDQPPSGAQVEVIDGNTFCFHDGKTYAQVESGGFVPDYVASTVREDPIDGFDEPKSPSQYYDHYVRIEFLPRIVVVPLFLLVFIVLLYLAGSFIAAGVGRFLWNLVEAAITRLPIVRNVYSSVKQVTDFLFTDNEIEFNRVVAVEYPRKGIWSIGFVTGESMLDISAAANESVLSVLMPTSPMPATGFTVTVKKSETVDLDLTIDQAIQFVVSCGVVVPEQQQQREVHQHVREAVADRIANDADAAQNNGSDSNGHEAASAATDGSDVVEESATDE